nr:protein phosphatase 1 regulatory subunit 11 [Pogona vitticeps]
MAESTTSVGATATVTETEVTEPENRSLTIKLRKRKPAKKVEWSSDTVDNEHLGRRSSKCELEHLCFETFLLRCYFVISHTLARFTRSVFSGLTVSRLLESSQAVWSHYFTCTPFPCVRHCPGPGFTIPGDVHKCIGLNRNLPARTSSENKQVALGIQVPSHVYFVNQEPEDEGCGNAHCIRGHKRGQRGKAPGKSGDPASSEGCSQKPEPPDQNHAGAMQH